MKKIIFFGDFFYDYSVQQKDMTDIIKWIEKQDAAVILNLEGPLVNSEDKVKKRGPHLFQSQPIIDI